MSNRAPKRPKEKKRAQTNRGTSERPRLQAWAGWAISGGLALITVISFRPRLTLGASDPLNPADPFSSRITITNNSFYTLRNVSFAVAMGSISVRQGGGIAGAGNQYEALLFPDIGRGKDLATDDKREFPFNNIIDGDKDNLKNRNFAVLMHYETPLLPLKFNKLFPLQVIAQNDGNFHWYAEPWAKGYTVGPGYRISGTLHLPHRKT